MLGTWRNVFVDLYVNDMLQGSQMKLILGYKQMIVETSIKFTKYQESNANLWDMEDSWLHQGLSCITY